LGHTVDNQLETEILNVSTRIRPELLNDFLFVANVDQLSTQTTALEAATESILRDADHIDALKMVRSRAPSFTERDNPWETGYRFAAELRANLNGRAWKSSPRGRFAVVSGVRTDRQQMNRAFAAEFLVPHEMLKNELSGAMIGEDEIEDLALEYGVSTFVVRHQIENHQLAQISL
jgi:hypothetical protein